jgi:hypothetical protein
MKMSRSAQGSRLWHYSGGVERQRATMGRPVAEQLAIVAAPAGIAGAERLVAAPARIAEGWSG